MPAQHQAMFDPIPPDLDLSALVAKTSNFDWVERIKLEDVKRMGWVEFEKLVAIQVLHGGRPLIVEGWGVDLPPWVYSADWLKTNIGEKVEAVRDITNETNHEMTIGHYLDNMGKLTKAMTPAKYRDPKRQRLYLKDIDCPKQWREQLSTKVPKFLFYMNENVSEIGEPGSTTYKNGVGQELHTQGIAPAGDLMSNLPPEMRAENLQLYIGHEGTYTPAHKEMCGTSSQNIMVETSSTLKDGEKDGSSIWFMTESQDREIVSEYFLSMLGHDIEIEKHFAQVVAWKKAPFPVYVAEQKVGDLVLVPPLAPHQVWNRGNRTIKVAWNRTTVETLEFALSESLPRARMVCRDEQYRVKATVYYSLVKYYARLREADKQDEQHEFSNEAYEKVWDSYRVQILKEDFTRLAKLFSDILVDEMFSLDLPKEKDVEYLLFEGNVTCSYCRCNIFNRFLTCKSCVEELVNGDEDTYDVCMDCYAMGRACACISGLKWVEQWRWAELTKKYDEYHDLVRFITTDPDRWILPLAEERIKRGQKTTAEVCQEQLLRRPWNDVKNPNPNPTNLSDTETDLEDEAFKKKLGGKRRRPKAQEMLSKKPCHPCKKAEKPWKLAECTTCDAVYCYGSLWRAFDLKPEAVMKHLNWRCPDCLDICSCASCLKKHPNRAIYEPKGTLLGHDTKAIADPRSVESLVDFSRSNLTWLRDNDTNPKKTKRMQKLIEEAKTQKVAYYRYAAVEWGMDPNNFGPAILKGYPKEKPERNGNIPAYARSFGADRSQEANDSGLDMDHRQTMSPSFDHTAPVPPMGVMGPPAYDNAPYPSNIDPYQTQNEGSSFQPINRNKKFGSPSELMNEPRAAYPTALTSDMPEEHARPAPAHNNDMDESGILFQDGDAPAPAPELDQDAYPRLPHETQEEALRSGMTAEQKKRKRQSLLVAPGVDTAHREFILTQQRQKLAAARKENRFYITQGQLLGGEPFMVILRVPSKKAELKAMKEIGDGRARVRHNPREKRMSVAHGAAKGDLDLDSMNLDEETEDGDIVISDVRPRRVGEVEPAPAPKPYQPGGSPIQTGKKRGRKRMRLPSLEPGAVPYEATVKKEAGRSRKSRGPVESGEEEDEDPEFRDRYSSPKRKKSVAIPHVSTGKPRGRPRKSTTQEAQPVEHLEISDDELVSDGETVYKQRSNVRASAHIEIEEDMPQPERAGPARKNRKSAGAVMESADEPALAGSKRTRGEVEFDHTMLPRNTKRPKRASTSISQSIIGGANDGACSGAEGYGDNRADDYQSQDDHSGMDDDDFFAARPAATKPAARSRGRSSQINDEDAAIADALFEEGEPMVIPMADDEEFDGLKRAPKPRGYGHGGGYESDDTLPAPSRDKQLESQIDEQSVRHHSKRQASIDSISPSQPTRESSAEDGYIMADDVETARESSASVKGGYRMADMPSSSPEHHRAVYMAPQAPPSEGYRMGSYDGVGADAEMVPTAGPEDDEDENLNAKFAVMREVEEGREREREVKRKEERRRAAEVDRRRREVEAEQKRRVEKGLERERKEEEAKVGVEKRAEGNGLAMLQAEQEAEAEVMKRAGEAKVRAEAREWKKGESSRVASDDSALGDGEDGDSDIEGAPVSVTAPSHASKASEAITEATTEATGEVAKEPVMMTLAERRAAQGKSGNFRVFGRRSLVGVLVKGLTPKERKRYEVGTVGAEDSGEETPGAQDKKRMRARSGGSGTPGSARRASGRRR